MSYIYDIICKSNNEEYLNRVLNEFIKKEYLILSKEQIPKIIRIEHDGGDKKGFHYSFCLSYNYFTTGNLKEDLNKLFCDNDLGWITVTIIPENYDIFEWNHHWF